MGRPTVLTPELRDRILGFLRLGAYIETAATGAGINKDTFYSWLKQGARLRALEQKELQNGKKPRFSEGQRALMDFSDSIEKAISESELSDLATIKRASENNWQAAAWRLERRHPSKYGQRQRVEMTGADGGAIQQKIETNGQIDLSKLTVEELKAYRAILKKGQINGSSENKAE